MLYFLLLLAALALYAIFVFNKLVRQRNLLSEAWSGIDVQLKLRHDLVPSLVEIVRGYSSHEQDTLENVTRLRTSSEAVSAPEDKQQIEGSLAKDMRKLLALVEAYPELKANKNFIELQKTLTEIEDNLQYARRYYNGTVRDLNLLVESFPSAVVARLAGYKTAKFFEITYATERQNPDISF